MKSKLSDLPHRIDGDPSTDHLPEELDFEGRWKAANRVTCPDGHTTFTDRRWVPPVPAHLTYNPGG